MNKFEFPMLHGASVKTTTESKSESVTTFHDPKADKLRDAAPELLAALKDAISDLEDSIPHQDVSRTGTCACLRHRHIREARALIARLGG